MADMSSQDTKRLVEELLKAVKGLNGFTSSVSNSSEAIKKAAKTLEDVEQDILKEKKKEKLLLNADRLFRNKKYKEDVKHYEETKKFHDNEKISNDEFIRQRLLTQNQNNEIYDEDVKIFKLETQLRRRDIDFQKRNLIERRDLWHQEAKVSERFFSLLGGTFQNMKEGFFKDNKLGQALNFGSKLIRGKDLSQTNVSGENEQIQRERIENSRENSEEQEEGMATIARLAKDKEENKKRRAEAKTRHDEKKKEAEERLKRDEEETREIEQIYINDGELPPPRMAKGGIVKARKGGKTVTVAEAGKDEAIIPLDKGGLNKFAGPAGWNVGGSAFKTNTQRFGEELQKGILKVSKSKSESSKRKDEGITSKVKDFLPKDKKGGGFLSTILAGLAGLLVVGGLAGFIMTGKSEYLGTVVKGLVKGGKILVSALLLPFKVGAKLAKTFAPKLAKTLGLATAKVAAKGVGKKVGSKVAQRAATGVAKKLGLAVLKKIPGLGLLISIPLAINRFRKGDYIGGLLELASGGASLIPGIGTALSIAIDMFTLFRDVKKDGLIGNKPPDLPNVEEGSSMKLINGKYVDSTLDSTPTGVSTTKVADNPISHNSYLNNQDADRKALVEGVKHGFFEVLTNKDVLNATSSANANATAYEFGKKGVYLQPLG